MPRHQEVTTCLKGGPISKVCTCPHCNLSVCAVCGAYEGSLTTDCPGVPVSFDKQTEVCETALDWTEARGWHQNPALRRSPSFEHAKQPAAKLSKHQELEAARNLEPDCDYGAAGAGRYQTVDPRVAVAPSIDWSRVDRTAQLQHALTLKAIAWVLADRVADDHSARLTLLEDEIDAKMPAEGPPDEAVRALMGKLEHEKIGFHLASQSAEKCDDEFRQAARQLVAMLERAAQL